MENAKACEAAGGFILSETDYTMAAEYASTLPLVLPNMQERYKEARQLSNDAYIKRAQMPRLEDSDVAELRKYLKAHLPEAVRICNSTMLPVRLLKPIQSNIYVDKVLNWIHEHMPIENAIRQECFSHLFIDGHFHIIEGHHRWLSMMLLKPFWTPRVYVIQSDVKEILQQLRDFSKKKGRVPND
jgi:hypothetical protein